MRFAVCVCGGGMIRTLEYSEGPVPEVVEVHLWVLEPSK